MVTVLNEVRKDVREHFRRGTSMTETALASIRFRVGHTRRAFVLDGTYLARSIAQASWILNPELVVTGALMGAGVLAL